MGKLKLTVNEEKTRICKVLADKIEIEVVEPVFLNQHLRPSISRQAYQPVLGSPGALRQSIAHADELPRQQQTSAMTTVFFMTSPVNAVLISPSRP